MCVNEDYLELKLSFKWFNVLISVLGLNKFWKKLSIFLSSHRTKSTCRYQREEIIVITAVIAPKSNALVFPTSKYVCFFFFLPHVSYKIKPLRTTANLLAEIKSPMITVNNARCHLPSPSSSCKQHLITPEKRPTLWPWRYICFYSCWQLVSKSHYFTSMLLKTGNNEEHSNT